MEKSNKKSSAIADYFVCLYTHLPMLILSNLLFLVCSIPVITAGPSLVALNRIACCAVRYEKVPVFREFFRIFRKEFKAGLILNVTVIPIFVAVGLYAVRSVRVLLEGWNTLAVLIFVMYFTGCAFIMYLLPLVAYMNSRGGAMIKNAILLCGANGLKTLLGGIITGVILLAGFSTYPYSFPVILLILFGLAAYNSCWFGWKGAVRFIFKPYYEKHPDLKCEMDLDI